MVEEVGLLDVNHRSTGRWSEAEWAAYTSAVLMVVNSYITRDFWNHSFVLYRAFDRIGGAARDIYKLNGLDSPAWESDAIRRLEISVDFCVQTLKALNLNGPTEHVRLRVRDEHRRFQKTIYDHLADLMFELIQHAESIRQSADLSWMVQHNIVWSRLLGGMGEAGPATRIVQFKLRRKIYDEIVTAKDWPNYRNIALLGFCIHVMGLSVHDASNFGREYRALHRAVLAWTRQNFVALQQRAPQVFDDCLPGDITYDALEYRLVRTYGINALRTAPKALIFLS